MYEENKDKAKNMAALMKATAQKVMDAWDAGVPEEKSRGFNQTIVAIGDRVFTAFPYELFSEIGMRIDRAMPDIHVLPTVCANGSYGYFVTEDVIFRGGYEVRQFLYKYAQTYCKDADFELIKATLENLKKL